MNNKWNIILSQFSWGNISTRFKLLVKMEKPRNFIVNGTLSYRIIGSLTIVIALLLMTAGVSYSHIGETVKTRYQKSSGRLIRNISTEDTRYYEYAGVISTAGRVTKFVGLFVLCLGIVITARPQLLFFEFQRLGLEEEKAPRPWVPRDRDHTGTVKNRATGTKTVKTRTVKTKTHKRGTKPGDRGSRKPAEDSQ